MDLMNLASAIGFADQVETYKMIVKLPDGNVLKRTDGVPMFIELESSDMSETALQAVRDTVNASIRANGGTAAEATNDFDTNRDENNHFYASITCGWNFQNLATGEDIPFTKDAAFKTYSGVKNNWLRAQIVASAKNQANFFQKRTQPLIG